jgi:hypothetical protein
MRRRSAFFTLPARSARGPDRAEPNVRTAPRRDVREYSAQIRIMTGRPPTSRKMLATTSRKLSDSVGGQCREGAERSEAPRRGDGDPGASAGALASNPLPWWEKLTMNVSLWVRFTATEQREGAPLTGR